MRLGLHGGSCLLPTVTGSRQSPDGGGGRIGILRALPGSFGRGGGGMGGSLFHLAHSPYLVRLDRAPICVLGEGRGGDI